MSKRKGLGNSGRVNIDNYKKLIIKIGIGKLPDALKSGHKFLSANMEKYHSDTSIRETINDYINDLNTYVDKLPAKQQEQIFFEDKGYSGQKWTGSKYKQTQNLSTAEIAKLIKKELEIEFEDIAKFSVTSEVYTGGASINVQIDDVSFNPYTEHFLEALKAGKTIHEYQQENKDAWNRYPERYNEELKALINKADAITNQYNFNDSDITTDYFHKNYYGNVGFNEDKYLQKHFPDSPDAKRHKEFSESWEKSRTASKAKADARKGKYKRGSLVWWKAELHKSWHKYKMPNGMYLVEIAKSPNGRARFSNNYLVRILENIHGLSEDTLKYHKKHGTDKNYVTNDYGTFWFSSTLNAYENDFLPLDDPGAKMPEQQKPKEKGTQATKPQEQKTQEECPTVKKVKSKKKKSEKRQGRKAAKRVKRAKRIEIPFEPVTLENYFEQNFDISTWPENLKIGHEFIIGETEGFKNIVLAQEDQGIMYDISEYLAKLNKYLQQNPGKRSNSANGGTTVRQVSLAVRFIKRYANLDGKTLTVAELSVFIKSLQKAMLTQQIRATDPHQQIIYHIQDELVNTYNNAEPDDKIKFTINEVEKYYVIGKSENEMLAVRILKRYVSLIGKTDKIKQCQLHALITKALNSGKIADSDVLKPALIRAAESLQAGLKKNGKFEISETELSGLQGLGFIPTMIAAAVGRGIEHLTHKAIIYKDKQKELGCPCEAEPEMPNPGAPIEPGSPLEGDTEQPQQDTREIPGPPPDHDDDPVMSVSDVLKLKFNLLGLDGEYLKLIGEACKPVSILIFGPGGSGKSTFTILFTNYLAKQGNRVLYVAGEQHNTPVMTGMLGRLKINDFKNFGIVKKIGNKDLNNYDVLVIDSKDSLDFSLEDFKQLRDQYPHLSFVILSQATKTGGFTGPEKWRNEVDTLIYCENLVAYTNRDKNRWGGSSEVQIYSLIPKEAT